MKTLKNWWKKTQRLCHIHCMVWFAIGTSFKRYEQFVLSLNWFFACFFMIRKNNTRATVLIYSLLLGIRSICWFFFFSVFGSRFWYFLLFLISIRWMLLSSSQVCANLQLFDKQIMKLIEITEMDAHQALSYMKLYGFASAFLFITLIANSNEVPQRKKYELFDWMLATHFRLLRFDSAFDSRSSFCLLHAKYGWSAAFVLTILILLIVYSFDFPF